MMPAVAAPQRRMRIVVVDDSSVARQVIRRGLETNLPIDVVGAAADGASAMTVVEGCRPDGVVLDVEMPGMDGVTALEEMRRRWPKLTSVIFTGSSRATAAVEARAMAAGAIGVVRKPPPLPSQEHAMRYVQENIGEPLLRVHRAMGANRDVAAPVVQPAPERTRITGFQAVVIGASTGGPDALEIVLRSFSPALSVPVIVVQHIGDSIGRSLLDRFSHACRVPVVEAADGTPVTPGRVYLASPGKHIEVRRSPDGPVLHTTMAPPEHFVRPAVDVLFRSACAVWERQLLAVVLTGMGEDGAAGCRLIKAAGGSVIVQDRASSVVWGMPGAVYNAGLADGVLPPAQIGPSILTRTASLATARPAQAPGVTP